MDELKYLKCLKCGYEWLPRFPDRESKACPGCRNYNWTEPSEKENIKELEQARKLLPFIHSKNIGTVITNIPDWTILVSPNDFGMKYPLVEIISNSELIKLYRYAEMLSKGGFPDFHRSITIFDDITDELTIAFVELFYALCETDMTKVITIRSIDNYTGG